MEVPKPNNVDEEDQFEDEPLFETIQVNWKRLGIAIALLVALALAHLLPTTGLNPEIGKYDKVAHLIFGMIAAAAAYHGFHHNKPPGVRERQSLLLAAAVLGILEASQSLEAFRTASLADYAMDLVGVVIVIGFAASQRPIANKK